MKKILFLLLFLSLPTSAFAQSLPIDLFNQNARDLMGIGSTEEWQQVAMSQGLSVFLALAIVATILLTSIIIFFVFQKLTRYKQECFLKSVVLFYQNSEWVRWVLFIPLTLFCSSVLILLFSLLCSVLIPESIFYTLLYPVAYGCLIIFFVDVFAPRWRSFFSWVIITIFILLFLVTLFAYALGMEVFPSQAIAGLLLIISAITMRYVNKGHAQSKKENSYE